MTKREFMEAIIAGEATQEELVEFATKEIEALNKRNAQRSSKPNARQIENEEFKTNIIKMFEGKGKVLASVVGEEMGFSTSKASALCRQLVAEDKMSVEDVKVPKKGTQKAYTVI